MLLTPVLLLVVHPPAMMLQTARPMQVTTAPAARQQQRACEPRCNKQTDDAKSNGSVIGRVGGYLYLGNFIAVVSLGTLSRLGLISLPPLNTLTAISNNAMDEEIAAGTLQPLLATGWAIAYWFDLIRQYFAYPTTDAATGFVASFCADNAALCTGVVY